MTSISLSPDTRIVELAPQPTVAVRVQQPMSELDIGGLLDRHIPAILGRIAEGDGAPGGAPFVRYHEFGGERADMEIGFPVATPLPGLASLSDGQSGEIGASELPGGQIALTVHQGPYDKLGEVYGALHDWIHSQGHDEGRGPWEVYVNDPSEVDDPAQVRTEVYWPVQ